jgi:hypothetical protein
MELIQVTWLPSIKFLLAWWQREKTVFQGVSTEQDNIGKSRGWRRFHGLNTHYCGINNKNYNKMNTRSNSKHFAGYQNERLTFLAASLSLHRSHNTLITQTMDMALKLRAPHPYYSHHRKWRWWDPPYVRRHPRKSQVSQAQIYKGFLQKRKKRKKYA